MKCFLLNPSLLSNLSSSSTSIKWRTQIKQKILVSQISSILIQRKNWIQLLNNLNLPSKLNPNIFNQILERTRDHAQISLDFFRWCQKSLEFNPDVRSHCTMVRILVDSNLFKPAKSLLDRLLEIEPTREILTSMDVVCKRGNSNSPILSFLLESYATKGLICESISIFRDIVGSGYSPSTRGCNTLLDSLTRAGNVKSSWEIFSFLLRAHVELNSLTWFLIVGTFCAQGKLDMAVKLLNSGISSTGIYNLIIDNYCKKGDLNIAFELLNEMRKKKLLPGFTTFSSILNAACKLGDVRAVELIMQEMISQRLIENKPLSDYKINVIIKKLCEDGKSYAGEMLFNRTQHLFDSSYICMLNCLSKEGRTKQGIRVYGLIREKGIDLDTSNCKLFVQAICKGKPSQEVTEILKDIIGKKDVISTNFSELSGYIDSLCRNGRWREGEDLLNMFINKGFSPPSSGCSLLIQHYCLDGRVDFALELHENLMQCGGSMDISAYNILLNALCVKNRIKEALHLFDYMRGRDDVNDESFSVVITALCRQKEMRRAMEFHEEMLRKGFKPNDASYRRLISGFK